MPDILQVPLASWAERLEKIYRDLVSSTGGQGPSVTKTVWLFAGIASVYCALVATLGGVSVYIFLGKADPVYWAAVGAMWVNALGFASSVQKAQHRAATEIAIGQQSSAPPAGGSQ